MWRRHSEFRIIFQNFTLRFWTHHTNCTLICTPRRSRVKPAVLFDAKSWLIEVQLVPVPRPKAPATATPTCNPRLQNRCCVLHSSGMCRTYRKDAEGARHQSRCIRNEVPCSGCIFLKVGSSPRKTKVWNSNGRNSLRVS